MELQVGVKVLLKNPEGKYLILLRAAEQYKEVKTKWDIPGGRINTDADLLKNLIREVKEETGLEIHTVPKLIAAQDIFSSEKNRHVVRLTYTGEASGEPKLSKEHTEFRWATPEELKSNVALDGYVRELLESGAVKN